MISSRLRSAAFLPCPVPVAAPPRCGPPTTPCRRRPSTRRATCRPPSTRVPGAGGQQHRAGRQPARRARVAAPANGRMPDGSTGDRSADLGAPLRSSGPAAQAERVPEVRRGGHRAAAAGVRRRLLRASRQRLPTRRQRAGLGRLPVGPGDELMIRAWGSIDVDYRSTVDRNGQINLPKVGSFNVAGVKAADLEQHLRAQIGRLYTNFNLNVSLGQLRGLRVFVVGPAQRAGRRTRCRASRRCCRPWSRRAGPAPQRLDAQGAAAPRRQGRSPSSTSTSSWSRATSPRTCSSSPATWSCSSPSGPRVALTGATRRAGDLRAQVSARSRCATCCATPAARRCWPTRTAPSSNASTRRSRGAARFVEEFELDAAGLAQAAARRRRADAAGDLAAVRQRRDAEGPCRAAAALPLHARACASAT